MDRTTELISSYAVSLDYSDLPSDTVHETKRRIIDSLGCAMGGYLSEPSKIARRLASNTSQRLPVEGPGQWRPHLSRDGCFRQYGDGALPGLQRYLRLPWSGPSQ